MTLERATQEASDAAAAGNQAALEQALSARAAAVTALAGLPPSFELASRVAAAIDAGKILGKDIAAFRLRLGFESTRLAQLQTGFLAGLGSAKGPSFDYRG